MLFVGALKSSLKAKGFPHKINIYNIHILYIYIYIILYIYINQSFNHRYSIPKLFILCIKAIQYNTYYTYKLLNRKHGSVSRFD